MPPTAATARLTVQQLAAAKGLPADFLRNPRIGLYDSRWGGGCVGIPYYDGGGRFMAVKHRTALRARDGSHWRRGMPPMAYGEWLLPAERPLANPPTALIVCEGESNCWACWRWGVRALGIPGANNADCLRAEHVEGVEVLYVARDPDQAGTRFVQGVLDCLAHLRFAGHVGELTMPEGCKDLSDLQLYSGASFPLALGRRLEAAGRMVLPSATLSEGEMRRLLQTLQRNPDFRQAFVSLLMRPRRAEGRS